MGQPNCSQNIYITITTFSFFSQLFDCPKANFGSQMGRQPHSPYLYQSLCIMFVLNRKYHQEPCQEVRSHSQAKCISDIQMRHLLILSKLNIPLSHSLHLLYLRLRRQQSSDKIYKFQSITTTAVYLTNHVLILRNTIFYSLHYSTNLKYCDAMMSVSTQDRVHY